MPQVSAPRASHNLNRTCPPGSLSSNSKSPHTSHSSSLTLPTQVKAALAARVSRPPSGQEAAHLGNPDALLPRLAVDIYGRVVDRVVGTDMGARPSVMHTPGIPQACVHGLASTAHFKMPSCTT